MDAIVAWKRHFGRKRKRQIGMGMRCFHLYIDLALEGERMGMGREGDAIRSDVSTRVGGQT